MDELAAYDYPLPKELIAQEPLTRRTDARLMVVNRQRGTIEHANIFDLPSLLSAGDCMALNDTRVVAARLTGFRTKTGGRWNGLFLADDGQGNMRMLGRTRGKIQPGETITLQDREGRNDILLHLVTKLEGGEWAARPDSGEEPLALLERVGRVPLPHYIRDGEMVDNDFETYQTVFARNAGAVAAPTAGLHFTGELLEKIQRRGVSTCSVTLHVGIGTFRPVTAATLDEHQMHSEWMEVTAGAIEKLNAARADGGAIVAVGTTAVRSLESAASSGTLQPFRGDTRLFIRPPYQFRAVDKLLTNFHLPRSTLLVLVRTFGGDELIKHAYATAVEQGYRFYSYGDAMLII